MEATNHINSKAQWCTGCIRNNFFHICRIGAVLPTDKKDARYSQVYLYAPDEQLEIRAQSVQRDLKQTYPDVQLLNEIQSLLLRINPFVRTFKTMRDMLANGENELAVECLTDIGVDRAALDNYFDLIYFCLICRSKSTAISWIQITELT